MFRHVRTAQIPILIFFIFLFIANPCHAGVLYSKNELMIQGIRYVSISTQWQAESKFHQKRWHRIKAMKASDQKKVILFNEEMARHTKRSHDLAGQRNDIQEVLIKETNARVKNSKGQVSGQLNDTAGTKFGEKGYRGMAGDRDMGGGSNTTQKVEDVLQEMGLYNPDPSKKSIVEVNSKAGTLEIKGDFDLTINKSGMQAKAGTQYHQIQVEIDARNPETYVSESMKTRSDGKLVKQQVGTEYVEVQDHRKKASKGLAADGDSLIKEPGKMQGMAKGTKKTLDMGRVNDDALEQILKQNGIKDNPVEFKKKLQAVKEGTLSITDAHQAERMRRASEDVFAATEQVTLRQTKKDIVDLRAKAAAKAPGDPVRLQIEAEIVDTVTKMKQTKAANEAFLSSKKIQKTQAVVKEISPSPKKITPETIDVEIKEIELSRPASVKQKAAKTFGAVMQIADIGQTCQTVEDYMEGRQSLGGVAVVIVDQYVTQGAIGTGKHIYNTSDDYLATRKDIQKANQNNMTAYLSQWEIQLRKTGMSGQEAKTYVSNAMLSGDLTILERKAGILRAEGKAFESPHLVTETYEADDTLWKRTKNTGEGIGKGIYDSATYSIKAPGRMVEAWAEGELKEAHLDAYAKEQTASSRSTIFQKLVGAGVPSRKALEVIDKYEENDTAPLRELFKQTRAKLNADEAAAKAEAEAAEKEIQIRAARLEQILKQYMTYLEFLKTSPLTLNKEPSPIELPSEGESVLVQFSIDNPQGNYLNVIRSMEKLIQEISGVPGKVTIAYNFDIPGKPGAEPNIWLTENLKNAGIYPVTAKVDVGIHGAGLSGPFMALSQDFIRPIFDKVEVVVAGGDVDYSKGIWPELRKTKQTDMDGRISMTTGAAKEVSYDWVANTGNKDKQWGTVQIKMSTDGKRIEEVILESFFDYESAYHPFKERKVFKNFILYSLDKETPTKATHAYYVMDDKNDYIWGTYEKAEFDTDTGGFKPYSKPLVMGQAGHTKVVVHTPRPSIHFKMSNDIQKQKWAKKEEVRIEKKAAEKTRQLAASDGLYYEGPMGEKEGFNGKIKINIGTDKTSVAGDFHCTREMTKDDKTGKVIVSGEFLGALNPGTGQLEAQVINGNMYSYKKLDGKWYPSGYPQGMSKSTRLIGKIEGNQIHGHVGNGKQKVFFWTAVPAKPGEKK